MKEAFIEKRFNTKSVKLIGIVNTILDDYAAAGYDLSLRQLYYQLVSRNIVPNTEKSYKNVGQLVSDARLAGLVDWSMIRDRGRVTVHNPHWDTPADIVRACANQFAVDRWANQPNYVEVMVEKQALEGVLIPVCEEWDVPFTANKGYTSSSAMRGASKRFLDAEENGKALHVIYLGDHDPSGIDMSRDIDDRLEMFTRGSGVTVHRVALNMDQVRKFRPPPNPAKMTDSRADDYVRKFGRQSWELDAIEPKKLAKLVEDAIKDLIDDDLWDESGKLQQKGRDRLQAVADRFNGRAPDFTKEQVEEWARRHGFDGSERAAALAMEDAATLTESE